jgi:hypothetical protein
MSRQFLAIPAASATAERVFSFAGLTLSDLRKSSSTSWVMSEPSSFLPSTVLLGIEGRGICSQSCISSLVLSASDFSGEMFVVCA